MLSRSIDYSLLTAHPYAGPNNTKNNNNEIISDSFLKPLFGTFRIYKFVLNDDISLLINTIISSSEGQFKSKAGMAVSNKGGFHSITNYFMDSNTQADVIAINSNINMSDKNIAQKLGFISSYAAQIAEHDDFQQSLRINKNSNTNQGINSVSSDRTATNEASTTDSTTSNQIRVLQSVYESEAWINIRLE